MEEISDIKVIKGSIPVLLSAPHAHSHKRPSLTMSYKWGEEYTDRIVEEICLRTAGWGVIQNKETDYDPNWYKIKNNPYKSTIADIISKEKVTKFIDIHGLSDEYDYDFGIYYPSKFNKSIALANDISLAINKGKLRGINICIFRFPDSLQESLGEYVADKLRVPSVQIEIARYIREDEKLRNVFVQNVSSFLLM